jgi:hypothetical protein
MAAINVSTPNDSVVTFASLTDPVPLDSDQMGHVAGGSVAEITSGAMRAAGAGAVAGSFAVGFAVGTELDKGLGISDKISDWAAEHFPWPW